MGDPNAMTDLQKKRSITFTFTDTDCWVFSYDHYCPGEQEDTERSYYCKSYTGGNFLFSGDSQEIHQDGECVVPPSPPPTDPPTNPPTTGTPTDEPTAAPTTSAPTTLSPTIKAVTRPPIITNGGDDDDDLVFQPTCPDDVKLIATRGSKDIDLERVVRIVSQDTSTVQVALNQGWEQEVS